MESDSKHNPVCRIFQFKMKILISTTIWLFHVVDALHTGDNVSSTPRFIPIQKHQKRMLKLMSSLETASYEFAIGKNNHSSVWMQRF